MSRLSIITPNKAQTVVEGLYRDIERRITASPPGLCPVDMAAAFFEIMSCADMREVCAMPCRIRTAAEFAGKGIGRQRI